MHRNMHHYRPQTNGYPPGNSSPNNRDILLALGDLRALVKHLDVRLEALADKIQIQETKMGAQDIRIQLLKQENSELWQEVYRLKGPRLPTEILLLIVESAWDDKPALKTFSLVCKSWLHVARKIIFYRLPIPMSGVFRQGSFSVRPGDILNSPHCDIFPYVQSFKIEASLDGLGGASSDRVRKWMREALVHMPKFTALTWSVLWYCTESELGDLMLAIPPSMQSNLRSLLIFSPSPSLTLRNAHRTRHKPFDGRPYTGTYPYPYPSGS
ncbi:hypothetical protein FB45DRAFT_865657 [Roridomyces roridus]|uniref:F-box domain-containing protein n=1 Tax=Roridomyces roridus TaxID=1738132 RepID=A0AAD7FNZ7_9AGAR|nr:hypothetical protein FB45DRAFT_865657 [Roridomyces roridus]